MLKLSKDHFWHVSPGLLTAWANIRLTAVAPTSKVAKRLTLQTVQKLQRKNAGPVKPKGPSTFERGPLFDTPNHNLNPERALGPLVKVLYNLKLACFEISAARAI